MSELQTLVTGRGLVEAPRWHDGRLYFSDWTAGEVLALDAEGALDVVARLDSLPLCTAFLPDGRHILVDSPNGRLVQRTPDGTLTTYADLGRPGWNDIVIDGRGHTYVNGADLRVMTGESTDPGWVFLVTPDGYVQQVATDIRFPNGMAVTADNRTLIVADSYGHSLVAATIADDGTLTDQRVWADLGEGTPDGICVDAEGCVWYADVPNQVCVRVAEGGAVRQTVTLDRGGFACALGGPARTDLFIVTATWQGMAGGQPVAPGSGQVVTTPVDVPGAGWP